MIFRGTVRARARARARAGVWYGFLFAIVDEEPDMYGALDTRWPDALVDGGQGPDVKLEPLREFLLLGVCGSFWDKCFAGFRASQHQGEDNIRGGFVPHTSGWDLGESGIQPERGGHHDPAQGRQVSTRGVGVVGDNS